MACLKCGKKTTEEQSFCPACLEIMEAYPVKSDVRVQLPNRAEMAAAKKSGRKRRILSAEEQISILQRRARRLAALALALAILLGAAVMLLIRGYADEEKLNFGFNYTYDNPFS